MPKEKQGSGSHLRGKSGPVGEYLSRVAYRQGDGRHVDGVPWRSWYRRADKLYDDKGRKLCGAKRGKASVEAGQTVRCRRLAGSGTDHPGYGNCKWHFGCTPAGIRNAFREEMEELLAGLQHQMGDLIEIDPAEALIQEVWRSNGMVMFLGELMKEMSGESVVELSEGEFKAAAFMDVFEKERMHLAKVAKMALEAGVAERRVQLAEAQGALVAKTFLAFINDMGLTPEQRHRAPALMRQHLLALGTQTNALEATVVDVQ